MVSLLGNISKEVRIQYSGTPGSSSVPFDWEGQDHAFFYRPCIEPGDGSAKTCEVPLEIPEDMEPPVLLMVHMDPFFQNFPSYIASGTHSGAWNQLTGHFDEDAMSKHCPLEVTRTTASGELIFPCGMQATSFFDDTFELRRQGEDIILSENQIAPEVDMKRMANPPNYGADHVAWLYERYPSVINKSEGVQTQRFVDWMRPAALPSMMKDMGRIHVPLKKGETVMLTIHSRFNVSKIGVKKELLLITPSPLGGSSDTFARFLIFAGIACLASACLVLAVHFLCPRTPGDSRFRGRLATAPCEESSSGSDYDTDGTADESRSP